MGERPTGVSATQGETEGGQEAEDGRVVSDVYIGRPSQLGNPFLIGPDGTREQVIEKYRAWLLSQPDLLAKVPMLKDLTLGCWCAPKACHGDVLAQLADASNE